MPAAATPSPARGDSRWAVLAGLRFVLAVVVVSGHLTWFARGGWPGPVSELGGTAAVLGFLVVSGYSIGHSLDRRPAGFYRRRAWRIYPLYAASVVYATVPFLSAASALGGPGMGVTVPRPTAVEVAGNLLLLQGLACRPIASNLPVWTLAIEAACYLAAPRLRRWSTGPLAGLAVVSAGAFAAYPWLGWGHFGTLLWGRPLLLFAWAWVAGFLLHRGKARLSWSVTVAVAGGVLLAVDRAYSTPYTIHTFIGSVAVVTVAPRVAVPPAAGRVLNYLGDLSYPLYLFHLPTLLLAYCILGVRGTPALSAAAVAVSAAALFVEATLKPVFARRALRRNVPERPAAVDA